MTSGSNISSNDEELWKRVDLLLQRFLDRTIVEEEADEFLDIWSNDPVSKSIAQGNYYTDRIFQFLDHSQKTLSPDGLENLTTMIRTHLDDSFKHEPSPYGALDMDELVRLAQLSPSLPNKPLGGIEVANLETETKKKPGRIVKIDSPRKLPWVFVSCLLLLIVALYFGYQSPPSSRSTVERAFRPFARLETALDVQWSDAAMTFKEGQELEAETLRFQSGIVQLELQNGVRIAVKGPADFRLNTVEKVFCGQGELSVSVPPKGKGFEVVTPFLSVVDLGTEFLVDVGPDRVETHTIKGKVEINRAAQEKIPLLANDAFSLDVAGTTRHFTARSERFLTDGFVRNLREKRDSEVLTHWKSQRDRILDMRGMRLFFDFEDDAHPGIEKGRILGAQAVPGRWKEKKAYSFKKKDDAVEFEWPGETRSMTLFASLRIDSLDRLNHVILAGRDTDAGSFVWQIFSDGVLQLAVRPPKGASPMLFRSRPIFDEKHCGVWYALSTTVDAERKEIRIWLDGKPVDMIPMPTTPTFRFGRMTLGNIMTAERTKGNSSFDGRIDQFMIFDRALTNTEITGLSENNM